MKKIYQIPEINVVEMQSCTICALSDFDQNLNGTGGDGSSALVKGGVDSEWDDEW